MVIRIDFLDPRVPVVDVQRRTEPHFLKWTIDVLRRLGGSEVDAVEESSIRANEAFGLALALLAGTPTGYTQTPAQPLSYELLPSVANSAQINVAEHARSTATLPLAAGSVATPVERDQIWYVYYSDPTDVGGSVTYLASADPDVVAADPVNLRLVGAIFIPPRPPTSL